jgi:hypothetical protein
MTIGTLCLRVLMSLAITSFALPMAAHATTISASDNEVTFDVPNPTQAKQVTITWNASDLPVTPGSPLLVAVYYTTNAQTSRSLRMALQAKRMLL